MAEYQLRIVDSAGGPIAGAEVHLNSIGSEITDADGRASIELPPGIGPLSRGARLATRDNLSGGIVTDLADRYSGYVKTATMDAGFNAMLVIGVETEVRV